MDAIIFVVGGGGLIGQAITEAHLRAGDTVYIWDDRSNPFNDYDNLAGYDVSHLSIKQALTTTKPDVVSHHAATVGVGRSQYAIKRCLDNNIGGTARWLENIRDYWMPGLLILAGSMAPYGEGPRHCEPCETVGAVYVDIPRTTLAVLCPYCDQPTDCTSSSFEGDELHPVSVYGVSKLAQEQLFKIFAVAHSVPVVSLRYFSVYGSQCNPNNPYTGVLSIIANKIINAAIVELNEDGLQTRDLIHVKDVARAHLAAVDAFVAGQITNEFWPLNIGTGRRVTLKSAAEEMISRLKPWLPLRFNGKVRVGDIRDSRANIGRANNWLGWYPTITLEGAIAQYCDYLKDNWGKFVLPDTCAAEDERLGGLLR